MIIILVFGVLTSLFYSSEIIIQGKRAIQIQELQAAPRFDATLSRMIEPDNICFSADQNFLGKYPAFVQGLKQADYNADIDIKTNSSYGNSYSRQSFGLGKNDSISLVSLYLTKLNQTTEDANTLDGRFTHEYRNFSCGLAFQQRYYQLDLSFETLKQVNKGVGYVPIFVTKELVEKKGNSIDALPNGVTFAPYNNTLVFYNRLPHPITVELLNMNETGESPQRLQTLPILSNKISDMRLSANWDSLNDTIYHYKVREYPWVEGDIAVSTRYSTECMSTQTAGSLYAQSDFDVKFPSYLPVGFHLACNVENTDTYLMQIYVNQSAVDYYTSRGEMHSPENPFPFYLYSSTPEQEVKGIFQVHAMKLYGVHGEGQDAQKILKTSYQYLLNQTSEYPQSIVIRNLHFIEIDQDGRSYLTYNDGAFLSTVEIATGSERYKLTGGLPTDEMLAIAKSLS